MFESKDRLEEQIPRVLEGMRVETGSRYAAVLDRAALRFEAFDDAHEDRAVRLRHFLERRRDDLFSLPAAMASEAPMEDDAFEEWREDEFVLAVLNGRVAVVLACTDAEAARDRLSRPLKVLADRLFRYDPRYRMDARGRGFFFGRAKLDVVVVGRPGPESSDQGGQGRRG